MPPKKQLKNPQPHPNRATDDPSEAESENPRERQILDNTNTTRDIVLSPQTKEQDKIKYKRPKMLQKDTSRLG
jgi:hypothetical protein